MPINVYSRKHGLSQLIRYETEKHMMVRLCTGLLNSLKRYKDAVIYWRFICICPMDFCPRFVHLYHVHVRDEPLMILGRGRAKVGKTILSSPCRGKK